MKENKGFTLIELLAVIVILAVIALIASPVIIKIINGSHGEAENQYAKLVIKQIEVAYQSAFMSKGGQYPTVDEVRQTFEMEGANWTVPTGILSKGFLTKCVIGIDQFLKTTCTTTDGHTYKEQTKMQLADFIPSVYQQVEYIESTGSQYIDTEVPFSNNLKVREMVSFTSFPTSGYSASGIENSILLGVNSSGYLYDGTKVTTTQIDEKFKYNLSSDFSTKMLYKDNSKVGTANVTSSSNKYYLFATNSNGTAKNFAKQRNYAVGIEDGTTLVRSLIPCYRKSDNVVGMYDLIQHKFYTNKGSGNFTKGEDVK